ncbi:MAG: hypothetical protein HPY50_14080 [Firmicutes bacterium]|nr:hypothetical protein [Bacillota bacterium]
MKKYKHKQSTGQCIVFSEHINMVIDQQIKPRLSSFATDVKLIGITEDGTVKVNINKGVGCLFAIQQDVLEKIVVSTIKSNIPEIKRVTFIKQETVR